MNTYGKTNLIDDLTSRTTGVSRSQIESVVNQALSLIQEQVKAGNRVTIPGFGTWQSTQRRARVGTNIRTKQKIQIPAQTGVRFTAGSVFKNAVSGKPAPARVGPGVGGARYARERAAGERGSRSSGRK